MTIGYTTTNRGRHIAVVALASLLAGCTDLLSSVPFSTTPSSVDFDWPMFRRDAAGTSSVGVATGGNGELLWKIPLAPRLTSSPAVIELNGTRLVVVVDNFGGQLYRIFAANGTIHSQVSGNLRGGEPTSPVVESGIIAVPKFLEGPSIYVEDLLKRFPPHSIQLNSTPPPSLAMAKGIMFYTEIVVRDHDDRIIHLKAYDAITGEPRWATEIFSDAFSTVAPTLYPIVASRDLVLAPIALWGWSSTANSLLAVNATSGDLLWRAFSSPPVSIRGAVSDGDKVYLVSTGLIVAVEKATGKEVWRSDYGGDGMPSVANGMVFVPGPKRLSALDARTGALIWKFEAGVSLASPALSGQIVFIGSSDGRLFALDAAAGTERWTAITTGAIENAPAVVHGTVYVASTDGFLYAFDAGRPAFG